MINRKSCMVLHAGGAILCGTCALLLDDASRSFALLDAFAAGLNLAGLLYNWLMIGTDRIVADIKKSFDEMLEIHRSMRTGL